MLVYESETIFQNRQKKQIFEGDGDIQNVTQVKIKNQRNGESLNFCPKIVKESKRDESNRIFANRQNIDTSFRNQNFNLRI